MHGHNIQLLERYTVSSQCTVYGNSFTLYELKTAWINSLINCSDENRYRTYLDQSTNVSLFYFTWTTIMLIKVTSIATWRTKLAINSLIHTHNHLLSREDALCRDRSCLLLYISELLDFRYREGFRSLPLKKICVPLFKTKHYFQISLSNHRGLILGASFYNPIQRLLLTSHHKRTISALWIRHK